MRPRHGVEAGEQFTFCGGILEDRLDDVVGVRQRIECDARRQTSEGGVAVGGGELVLLDEFREALFDRRAGAIEHRLCHVDEADRESRLREHLGDAVPHRARADDADVLDRLARHNVIPVPPPAPRRCRRPDTASRFRAARSAPSSRKAASSESVSRSIRSRVRARRRRR